MYSVINLAGEDTPGCPGGRDFKYYVIGSYKVDISSSISFILGHNASGIFSRSYIV